MKSKDVDRLLELLIIHGLNNSCEDGLFQALNTIDSFNHCGKRKYLYRFLLLSSGRYQQCYNLMRLEEPCLKEGCSHQTPCGLHGQLLFELTYALTNEEFLTEFDVWKFDGIWEANADITEEFNWMVEDLEDPEMILQLVIPVMIRQGNSCP